MTTAITTPLAALETGLRRDLANLENEEREFAKSFDVSPDWKVEWDYLVSRAHALLDFVKGLVAGLGTDMEGTITDRIHKAEEFCQQLHAHVAKLVIQSNRFPQHRQVPPMNDGETKNLVQRVQAALTTFDETLSSLQNMFIGLEGRTELKKSELDQAAVEIEQEQHAPGGLMDTIKTMFLWVETPEERARKIGVNKADVQRK